MSTTRCKIPLGMFYGHLVVLPGEDYSEVSASEASIDGAYDSTLQATIDSQCNILSALAEDVQCRFVHCLEFVVEIAIIVIIYYLYLVFANSIHFIREIDKFSQAIDSLHQSINSISTFFKKTFCATDSAWRRSDLKDFSIRCSAPRLRT